MYKPPRNIVVRLKEYDKDLDARWDNECERWRVTWRGKDIFLVENDDGSYRALDERVVSRARYNDAWRYRNGKEFARMLDEENHRITAAQRAKLQDDCRQMMIEDGYREMFGSRYVNGWNGI